MDELQSDASPAAPPAWTGWRDWQWLVLLLALVAPVRVWLLVNTEVMARDSVGYIRYALRFDEKPWAEVLNTFDQHPGYPFAIWLVSLPVRACVGQTTPEVMQLCAQLVSGLAALVLAGLMFYLGKALWDARIGFGGSLIFQLLPVSGQHLSDGISESLFLVFVAAALLVAVWGLQTGRSRWFTLCGVFTGLAYLTRPEGALLLGAVGFTLLGFQGVPAWRQPWRRLARHGAGLVTAAVLIGSLYVLATGKFSNKQSINQLLPGAGISGANVEAAPPTPGLRAQLWAVSFVDVSSYGRRLLLGVWSLVTESTAMLLYVGLAPIAVAVLWQRQALRRERGCWVLLVYGVLHLASLLLLASSSGYVSDRHLMPLVMILSYLLMIGLLEMALWVAAWRRPSASVSAHRVNIIGLTVLALLLASGLPLTLKRLHANRAGNHVAGLWLAKQMKAGDLILDDHTWSHYYAGQVFLEHKEPPAPPQYQPTCYVVVTRSSDPKLKTMRDKWEQQLRYSHGTIVFHWPEVQAPETARLVVYALPRDRHKQPWRVAKN